MQQNKFEVNISKQISLSLRVWRLRLSKVAKDKVAKYNVNKVNKMVEGVVANHWSGLKMPNKEVARVERGQVRLAALQLGNKVRVASI